MKKHCLLLVILNLINFSTHIHGMKREVISTTNPINLSVLLILKNTTRNRVESFLPFRDYETEKEFIERTRSLTIKTVPEEYTHKHISQSNIKYAAYSSDNAKIIISEKSQQSDLELMSTTVMPKLIVIDRFTQQHKQCCIGNTHQHLAISRSGERFATIDSETVLDDTTRRTINKHSLVVTRFNWNENINHDIPLSFELSDQHPTIAFNKQGTRIIVHDKNFRHIIFPTSNVTHNENMHKQTLTLEKYFQQRGICKNLFTQLRKQKENDIKTTT